MFLPHQFLLLALDESTGRSVLKDPYFWSVGLAGAFLAELQLQGRLVPVQADRFAVVEHGDPLPGSLGLAESALRGYRPLAEGRILGLLNNRSTKLRRAALDELVAMGALRLEEDKLWILTWRRRWPESDPGPERTLVEHLRHWLATVAPEDPPAREDLILSLLRCAKNLERVWTPGELERLRPRIEERTARAPVGAAVKRVVDGMKAAAAAAAAGT